MNLNQVTIPVSNVEKSIEFYQRLGLILIVRALPHYARFVCPEGNSTFSLHLEKNLSGLSGIMVYFETKEIDTRVNELIQKGIRFDELPTDQSWLWREARLKDPDNNQLVIYYAGENRLNPPWKI